MTLHNSSDAVSEKVDETKVLVDLLEFEIERIDVERSRAGWTSWALLGAFATTLWLLTAELQVYEVRATNLGLLFLFFSLLYEDVTLLFKLLSDDETSSLRFFTISKQLPSGRPGLLLDSLRALACILITSNTLILSKPYRISIYFYFGFQCVGGLLTILLSFSNIPFPRPAYRSKLVLIPVALLLIAVLAPTADLLYMIRSGVLTPTMPEYRVAGLLFSAYLTLFLFAKAHKQVPLLQTLVEMRRSVGLGRIDATSTRNQLIIAVEGLSVSDVFQKHLAMLLADLEQANIHLDTASREIQASTQNVTGLSGDERSAMLAMVSTSLKNHSDAVKVLLESFSKRNGRFRGQILGYEKFMPGTQTAVLPLQRKLDESVREFELKRQRLVEEIQKLEHFRQELNIKDESRK